MSRTFSHLSLVALLCFSLVLSSCQNSNELKTQELWIYTSLYKDTLADITPRLEKAFPGVKFNFYQAGSEEVAAKVAAEQMSGGIKADILIFSDRFWFEEAAQTGQFIAYTPAGADKIPASLKHPQAFYHAASIPVMVLAYNSEVLTADQAPKTFREMAGPKWKGKFTTGSPLASGTNFTTLAMLQARYGWEYVTGLRQNDTLSEGGNSAVIGRLQSKERVVGWVLLENLLRLQGKDERIKAVFPEDGSVTQANVLAITASSKNQDVAKKFADWMFSQEGQEAMTRSFMYSPFVTIAPPVGAPEFGKILEKAFPWDENFIKQVTAERNQIKEKFTEIMFQ